MMVFSFSLMELFLVSKVTSMPSGFCMSYGNCCLMHVSVGLGLSAKPKATLSRF